MADTDKKNALAELAERLKNGIYNNPNDARFDKPVVCASLDANDVLKTQRIIAEFSKVEDFDNTKQTLAEYAVYLARFIGNCRMIAEEGWDDGR